MEIWRGEDRGRSRYAWLDSRHTFSFAGYYDPDNRGVSVLRVINDDRVVPGAGFEAHGHRDMEIISYVLEGALEHKDSMNNITRINAGEFQAMTAGTGVVHSEYNPSDTEPTHLLQIWIRPGTKGLEPAYQQAFFKRQPGRQLIVSPDGREDSLRISQDATLERFILPAGARDAVSLQAGRMGFLHVVAGEVLANQQGLAEGDGVALKTAGTVPLGATKDAELLWFDLPASRRRVAVGE